MRQRAFTVIAPLASPRPPQPVELHRLESTKWREFLGRIKRIEQH